MYNVFMKKIILAILLLPFAASAENENLTNAQKMQILQQMQHSRPNADKYVNSLNKSQIDNVQISASNNGHFYLPVQINGRKVEMMADTGASAIFLTQEDAVKVGINLSSLQFNKPYNTANGKIYAAEVIVPHINVNGIEMTNIPVTISQQRGSDVSLLGMSFFKKLSKYEVNDGVMTLYK